MGQKISITEKLKALFQNHWLGIFSGLMAGTSYVPFPPWAVLFCYVPLMLVIIDPQASLKKVFWNGWWSQFILSLIGFYWIYHVATEFGHLPPALSVIILLLFASIVHVYIPLACVATRLIQNKFNLSKIQTVFAFSIIFSLCERAWPGIFDWHYGYTLLWVQSPAAQWADVIGFEGLASLLLLTQSSVLCFFLLRKEKRPQWQPVAALAVPLVIWGTMHITGNSRKIPWSKTDGSIHVAPIQANIGNLEKIQSEQGTGYEYKVIQRHFDLMHEIVKQSQPIDLMIWPETAFPDFLDQEYHSYSRQQFLFQQLKLFPSATLLGSYSRQKFPPKIEGEKPKVKNYNALFLFDENQKLAGFYRKTHLLIFGEYIPLGETFPVLLDWFPFIAGFGRGPGPTVLDFAPARLSGQTVKLGSQICYEGLSPAFSRSLANQGAQIFINLTNDSWFGKHFEPYQHMIMTLARAIETRRPLIRSTNTGITTVIQADGQLEALSPIHEPWVNVYEVRFQSAPQQTFFVQYGHFDWILLSFIFCALLIFSRAQRKTTAP